MEVGKEIIQNIKKGISTNGLKFSLVDLKELMLWQDPDFNNSSIIHAIAKFGHGAQYLDLMVECKNFELKNEMLKFFMQRLDNDGNSCIHLAADQNNFEFLNKLFDDNVSSLFIISLHSKKG